MNDFKDYSAAFHAQNDDVLHFGVKGMKWKHHKRQAIGVVGLIDAFGKAKKVTDKEEEKPSRGTYADAHPRGKYADSERAAAQKQTVEKNRSDLSKLTKGLESYRKARKDAKAHQEEAARSKFTQAAAKGLANDQYKKTQSEIVDRANKKAYDKELDKERKRRQRKYANLKKAEEAYRRGGH